jgi:hypothetical protein
MAELKADVLVPGAGLIVIGAAPHLQKHLQKVPAKTGPRRGLDRSPARRLTPGPATGRRLAEMMTGEPRSPMSGGSWQSVLVDHIRRMRVLGHRLVLYVACVTRPVAAILQPAVKRDQERS